MVAKMIYTPKKSIPFCRVLSNKNGTKFVEIKNSRTNKTETIPLGAFIGWFVDQATNIPE